MKKKIIITYGTFDVLHYGHVNLLKRAKALGDYLIVGLSTDEFNEQKGKKSYYSYCHRSEILQSIKYVDKVIPEECWEQKVLDLKNYDVDVFVMGNDWEGKFDFLSDNCKVIYLPRTEGISSTLIRQSVLT
ncbi:glycerol-3-phosphate cytidylyltransferase [Fictibacillus norfolkensis]|uniref:Glycerol-3-phosphate cytidylyltransferase n=1 Tax=Fictibacillus norfolkensis TaxID=2762233 RepID=A0ABR8SIL9_9BACL|nr:glycerol-3-phosphate cytidylyltransferase [Fictibacillus norfolkensis]MBD7963184.1 glycerol-3-phosphate cytidylyltransferase [Fictibacillus norfolkensis]